MKSKLLLPLLTSMALFALTTGASATSLFLDDCDAAGCEGSTLFASVEDQGGVWRVTYTINTDDYTGDRTGFN